MSIVDIEQSKTNSNVKGIGKTIDENALTLILDNVQISQYVYPEASTVRELTSNAVDGQKEKEKAIEILTGKSKVEDYYITRDDEKYKDSNFKPEYYDLKSLDTKNNKVVLTYVKGREEVGWCDKFIVKDFGVGLGDGRLYGYFQIGYSSKRNTVSQLGGFGLGAKVGLSLRNDFFTTETVHNGRLFRFNCYSYKVDSLIGRLNLVTGKENPSIMFPTGEQVYYEETTSLNYTQVTVPCKTHHRDKFKHAVESQLLYFDNVEFNIVETDGTQNNRSFKADVLYNSQNLIIAKQHQYSKPHIIVVKEKDSPVGVSYGYVNFREMEMQDLFGSVGFKCPIRQVTRDNKGQEVVLKEGIEVTPSRESVIWSDATRTYVKGIIDEATLEANTLVEKQLKEDDFLVWLNKAKNVLGNTDTGTDGALYHLSKIIDRTQLNPTYSLDKTLKYETPNSLLWGMSVRRIFRNNVYKNGKYVDEIKRDDVGGWHDFNANNLYIQTDNTSTTRDFYLGHTIGVFNTIRVTPEEELLKELVKPTEKDENGKDKPNKWTEDYVKKLIDKRNRVLEFIKKSKLYKSYESIEVPEDWIKKFEATQIKDTEVAKEEGAKLPVYSPADLRKLAEKTVAHVLVKDQYRKDNLPFSWSKIEPKISELKDDESEIYYDHGDSEKLQLTTVLLYGMYNGKFDKDFKLIRVSKSMPKKFLKKHKFIDDFYKVQTATKVGMSKQLVQWLTAKMIHEKLEQIKFMRNYKPFNLEVQELYEEVKAYSKANFTENYMDYITKYNTGKDFIESMLDYTTKVCELQLYIREHSTDSEAVKQKSLELFGIDTISSAIGLNLDMYDKLVQLMEYAEPVKALFNHIDILTDIKAPIIPFDTEILIKEVIDSKGLSDFKIKVVDESTSDVSPLNESTDNISERQDSSTELELSEELG